MPRNPRSTLQWHTPPLRHCPIPRWLIPMCRIRARDNGADRDRGASGTIDGERAASDTERAGSSMALITYAQAAASALAEAMRADNNIVALGEDLGRGGIFAQYRGLQQEFGAERVIDTPISEATIMGA